MNDEDDDERDLIVFPPPQPRWTMVSEEPLTLTPSVLCSCGWHGHITNGKWVPC